MCKRITGIKRLSQSDSLVCLVCVCLGFDGEVLHLVQCRGAYSHLPEWPNIPPVHPARLRHGLSAGCNV